MSALSYLLLTRMKNRLKTFFTKPSNLIATLFMIAMLVLLLWTGNQREMGDMRPMSEFYGLVYILLIAVYAFSAYQGLGRGASLFSMADVQLVFPSPISSRRVLFYGMIQQMGSSILMGFFLLFQYGWLSQNYLISMGTMLLILVLYGAALFMGQLTAMAAYVFISGHPRRKQLMTYGYFGVVVVYAAGCFLIAQHSGHSGLNALLSIVDSPIVGLFPVGGWLAATFHQGALGNLGLCLAGLGGTALIAVLLTRSIVSAKGEYYEDVLAATARSHQAITAKKEGRAMEALPEHVKVGRQGLGGGWGASAIFYKHRLEARRGRRFLLDTMSLVFVVITLVFSFFMRQGGMLPLFCFATYMQLFSVATGRWVRELQLPWIYRMPDSAFRRLMACLGESCMTYALEAALVMIPMGLMCGEGAAVIAMGVVARFLLSMLFVAGNLLEERLFGGVKVKMLQILLYVAVMLVLLAPCIALCIFMITQGTIIISFNFTVFLWVCLPTLVLAPLCIFLSRGLLDHIEMSDR